MRVFTYSNYFLFLLNKKNLFSAEQSKISIRRTVEFISNVVQEAALAKPSSANPYSYSFDAFKITYQGEVQDLDESSIEYVLNWDKVGVFSGV